MRTRDALAAAFAVGLILFGADHIRAEPVIPTSDDQVVEVLPASTTGRNDDRRMRMLVMAKPADARLAVIVARRDLDRARDAGDPRFAGQALAVLSRWPDASTAPVDVVLVRATILQFLHEFEASKAALRTLLARSEGASMDQAWLTLATILRVQGRYAESDEACRRVAMAGAAVYGRACLAENLGLKGDVDVTRREFRGMLADPSLAAGTRGWLLTSLAELEQRDGDAKAAGDAYRAALAVDPNAYVAVAAADFLIDHHQPAKAIDVLKGQARTDAVLLRLTIASHQAHLSNELADVNEMRERIALANTRPDARLFHGREQALFALDVDDAPREALTLARGDVSQQREPIDVLVLARSAKAAGDPQALSDAKALQKSMGLHDRRIDAIR